MKNARSLSMRIREIGSPEHEKFKIALELRIFGRGGESTSTAQRRHRPLPLDGAVDDLTLTDSRLLLVASALFISPILLWTLRSSILAPYVTTSALSSLPFVRANLAERVLPSSTCNDTRPSRRRSFKMRSRRRQPRGPPHHPRVQHETSLALARYHEKRLLSRNRNKRKTSGVDGDHRQDDQRHRTLNTSYDLLVLLFPFLYIPCVIPPTTATTTEFFR